MGEKERGGYWMNKCCYTTTIKNTLRTTTLWSDLCMYARPMQNPLYLFSENKETYFEDKMRCICSEDKTRRYTFSEDKARRYIFSEDKARRYTFSDDKAKKLIRSLRIRQGDLCVL